MPDSTEVTQAIWERQPGEPARWYARFLLYRGMGPDRTLLGCIHREEVSKGKEKQSKNISGSWSMACERWQWKARAEQYDADQQAQAEERRRVLLEIEAEEERRILTTGYARIYKRIDKLTRWIDALDESMVDPETGKINPKWVSSNKVEQIRGSLDDIAKELGHRIKKSEITGKDGGPISYTTNWAGGVLEDSEEKE